MADTDTDTLPNGTGALSAEEEERLQQRPADIDADVRGMERSKRVEALMSSRMFREELERVLDQQINEGGDAPLLQRIREMVGGRLHTGSLRGPSCVLPINDIRGIEGVGYEKGEKILRCKLAAVYRLVDLFGWTQTGMSGQITARLNTAVEQMLTVPRGLLPHEVTASSLVKVDMQGNVIDAGTTNFPVNVEWFSVHASVHAARPDVRCVLHVRCPAALAVSSTKRGLLPLCHEAALLGEIAYHRVPHGELDNEEQDKLVRALGPHAKVLVVPCAGALCCGATLEEALQAARHLVAACDVQLRLAALPLAELNTIDDDTRAQIYESSRKPPGDAAAGKWRPGGEEFEALMRMLDNAGFRTGHIYRNPLIKNEPPKPKNDVEVPPAVSSLGYLLEEEELYRQGLWKKGTGKAGERTRWLNSPNVYQKVEVLETGTNDPRKITKWVDANNEEWVQDGSPAHSSTPVKIDTLQFVPKNTNPKEFKKLQQQIKDNRRADKISAGPQSHILEGVTWDEASKLVGEDAVNTLTGDHVVLMGAASKGIIQRGHQHNATVYSAPYARNPFDHVTDNDIEDYRRTVENKQRGLYDTDLSESEAISAAQITSPASAFSETEEESRDEHRVLRIETKQAPVRSQPEVVLSDVDTTDFLHSERAHADRTKDRDPNLLSDDEVFLPSSVTSPVASPVPVRVVVHQTVGRGKLTPETIARFEAFSSHKRSLHDYHRSHNLESAIKKFDALDDRKHPKCKISLHSRLQNEGNELEIYNPGTMSSRSSLYSIPSIEWDGRCRSLPRFSHRTRQSRLFRTQSHSGFVTVSRDPDPVHYHLPRCRSCGAANNSYAWELTKELKSQRKVKATISEDDVHQKFLAKTSKVKVTEKEVPVFKVLNLEADFVESQEFTEDNYLGELGTSFSSNNQTVIEKLNNPTNVTITEDTVENDAVVVRNGKTIRTNNQQNIGNNVYGVNENEKTNKQENKTNEENISIVELYRAEYVTDIDTSQNTTETEGEYHSFSDETDFQEAVYESPVKELVEKDIRDYSIPMAFYCDDYANRSPGKSPKQRDISQSPGVLEPILEESKSFYDDSGDSSKEKIEMSKNYIFPNNVGISEIEDNKKENIKKIKQQENIVPLKEFEKDTKVECLTVQTKCFEITKKSELNVEATLAITDEHRSSNTNHEENVISVASTYQNTDGSSNTISVEVVESSETLSAVDDIFTQVEACAETKTEISPSNCDKDFSKLIMTDVPVAGDDMYFKEEKDKETKYVNEVIVTVDNVAENRTVQSTSDDKTSDIDIHLQFVKVVEKSQSRSIVETITDDILVRTINNTTQQSIDVKSDVGCINTVVKSETDVFIEKNVIKSIFIPEKDSSELITTNAMYIDDKDVNITVNDLQCATDDHTIIAVNICSVDKQIIEYSNFDAFENCRVSSISVASEFRSFDSTVEFEKYEVIADIIGNLINRIEAESFQDMFVNLPEKRNIGKHFELSCKLPVPNDNRSKDHSELEISNVIVTNIETDSPTQSSYIGKHLELSYSVPEPEDNRIKDHSELVISKVIVTNFEAESITQSLCESDTNSTETVDFSIAKIVQEIEMPLHLNVTESSDAEVQISQKVAEALLYHIFDNAFFDIASRNKIMKKQSKKVVTVVDVEDILFTAIPLWNIAEKEAIFSKTLKNKPNGDTKCNDLDVNIELQLRDAASYKEESVETCLINEETNNPSYSQVMLQNIDLFEEINAEAPAIQKNCVADSKDGELNDSMTQLAEIVDNQYSTNTSREISFEFNYVPIDDEHFYDEENEHAIEIVQENDMSSPFEGDDRTASDTTFVYGNSEMVNEILSDVLEKSISDCDSDSQSFVEIRPHNFDETFILSKDMDTAFIADLEDQLNRSSSPNQDTYNPDVCTESPIRNPNESVVDDLSSLYEKEDSILGSPFVKKITVLSMSQTVQAGGIKYWLSFDDSLTEHPEQSIGRHVRRYEENKLPSFVAVNFDDNDKDDFIDIYERDIKRYKRDGVLLRDFDKPSDLEADVTYNEACVSNYATCDDIDQSKSEPHKKLIYDIDFHTRPVEKRASWPPFEDTLFYRIISKFRMSESFDPSDFDNVTIDTSS